MSVNGLPNLSGLEFLSKTQGAKGTEKIASTENVQIVSNPVHETGDHVGGVKEHTPETLEFLNDANMVKQPENQITDDVWANETSIYYEN